MKKNPCKQSTETEINERIRYEHEKNVYFAIIANTKTSPDKRFEEAYSVRSDCVGVDTLRSRELYGNIVLGLTSWVPTPPVYPSPECQR